MYFLTLREDGFEQEQKAKEGSSSSSSSSTSSASSALSSSQSSNNLALAAGSIPKSSSSGSISSLVHSGESISAPLLSSTSSSPSEIREHANDLSAPLILPLPVAPLSSSVAEKRRSISLARSSSNSSNSSSSSSGKKKKIKSVSASSGSSSSHHKHESRKNTAGSPAPSSAMLAEIQQKHRAITQSTGDTRHVRRRSLTLDRSSDDIDGSPSVERSTRRELSDSNEFTHAPPIAVSSSLPTNVPASAFKHPPLLQQQQKSPSTTAITPRSGASFLQLRAPRSHVAWLNRATGELQSRIEKESLLDSSSSSAICSALRTAMEAIEEARRQIEALESPPPTSIEGSKLANNLGSSSSNSGGGVINTGRSRSQEYDRTTVEAAGISPPLPPSISPINVTPIDDESVGEEAGPASSSTSPTGGAGSSPKESSGIEATSGAIAAALANKHLAQLPPPLVPIPPPTEASPDS